MGTSLRLFCLIVVVGACASIDAFAQMAITVRRHDPSYNMRFYKDRWDKSDPRFCADSGTDCKWVPLDSDPSGVFPSTATLQPINGGYSVTMKVPVLKAEAYNGSTLDTLVPKVGYVIQPRQLMVRLMIPSSTGALVERVVDFSGVTVDASLNVTTVVSNR